MEELLKSLEIPEEDIKKILKGMKEQKIFISKEENIDERYLKLKGQKEDLEEEIKASNKTIDDLKKNNKDNEILQQTIKEHEVTIDSLKSESSKKIRNLTLENTISNLLRDNKAKYIDLLMSKFDKDKLEIKEDGKIEGLMEQFKAVKENYKDLFEQPLRGTTPVNKESSSPSTEKNPWKKETFNLTEQGRILRENPSLAEKLMKEI